MTETALERKSRIKKTIYSLLAYNLVFLLCTLAIAFLLPKGEVHEGIMRNGLLFLVAVSMPYNNNRLSLWITCSVCLIPVFASMWVYSWLAYGYFDYDPDGTITPIIGLSAIISLGLVCFISYSVVRFFNKDFRFFGSVPGK